MNGEMEGVEARMPGRSMSPLVLAEHQENAEGGTRDALGLEGAKADETQAARSPTPEPEDPPASAPSSTTLGDQGDIEMTSDTTPTSTTTQTPVPESHTSDPANQPYLGRVDELDTGPIQPSPSNGAHGNGGREDEHVIPGTGEGGGMTPHGMSEKPVPISSTTVISEEERRVAGLRQQNAGTVASDNEEQKLEKDTASSSPPEVAKSD